MLKNLVYLMIVLAFLDGCSGQAPSASKAEISPVTSDPKLSLFAGSMLGPRGVHYGIPPLLPPANAVANLPNSALTALAGQKPVEWADADPKILAAARHLQTLTHESQTFIKILDMQMAVLTKSIMSANQGSPERARAFLQEIFLQRFEQLIPAYLDANAHAFAQHYSLEEMNEIIAFYESPVGTKLISLTPVLQQEIAEQMKPVVAGLVAELVKELKLRAAKQGLHLPQNI